MCGLEHGQAESILDFPCGYGFLTHRIAGVPSTHVAFIPNRNIMSLWEVWLVGRHN